jgi:hypothetical protein
VCDAPRQSADGFHFLRVRQLLLQPLPLFLGPLAIGDVLHPYNRAKLLTLSIIKRAAIGK